MKLLTLSFLLSVLACSTTVMKKKDFFAHEGQSAQVQGENIQKVLESRGQLPKPFKLAVYFEMEPSWGHEVKFRWSQNHKDRILMAFENNTHVSAVQTLVVPIGGGRGYEDLRFYAAQQGADALLVVKGLGSIDRSNTMAAWSYIAILPAFFVKGTEVRGEFLSQALLYDVRNSFLYFAAQSEGEARILRPAFFTDEEKVRDEAMNYSVSELSLEINKLAKSLK